MSRVKSEKDEKRTVRITRDKFREIKRLDHAQMETLLTNYLVAGFEEGKVKGFSDGYDHGVRTAEKALREGMVKAVLDTVQGCKGVGPRVYERICAAMENLKNIEVDIKHVGKPSKK